MTVIPAPSETPTPDPRLLATATPMAVVSKDGISIGSFVQINGTEGDGLRLRSGPGIDDSMRFIGMEAEAFEVRDGPVDADDITWWYLVAPYDESRSGWAAAQYLTVISQQP
ncbi:MAG: hypothetical protein GYA17_09740 [Chloroflexi bacterium]|nr:hypothetical protein [Anaerolineaceae bacterium]NMB88631.1 hypothetical protein [Chloroflexota bacterium]